MFYVANENNFELMTTKASSAPMQIDFIPKKTILVIAIFVFFRPALALENGDSVRLESYFDVSHYSDVAISNGGEFVAVEGWTQDIVANASLYALHIYQASDNKYILIRTISGKARHLEWHPSRKRLYYVAQNGQGVSQIFQREFPHFSERQVTDDPDGVVDFKISPDGEKVAWRKVVSSRNFEARPGIFVERAGVYERLQNDTKGYFVDAKYDSLKTFINPDRSSITGVVEFDLIVSRLERINATTLDVPKVLRDYEWSPDSSLIALMHTNEIEGTTPTWETSTSVSLYDLTSGQLRPIASPALLSPEGGYSGSRNFGPSFSFGPWMRISAKLMILRSVKRDPSVINTSNNNYEWALFDTSEESFDPKLATWHPTYIFRDDSEIHSTPKAGFVSAKIVNGGWGVWQYDESGLNRVVVPGIDGAVTNIYSSIAGTDHALVVESTARPPEIYVSDLVSSSIRATEQNSWLPRFLPSEAEKIWWRSSDGEVVGGWFLDGRQTTMHSRENTKPVPLITYIHGGPGGDVSDGFSDIGFDGGSSGRGKWAYPFEVLASEGVSIFFPNYRPNPTYHVKSEENVTTAGAGTGSRTSGITAIDDILSGIQYLIDNGYADADRLGLAGHSYGGMLGPRLLQYDIVFEVASFAEGSSNEFNRYLVNPGLLAGDGGPEAVGMDRLIEHSPEFHFKGLSTATLFESGARSGITGYLGAIKAAQRAKMPSELVLYPRAEHNTVEPAIQYSVAENNYDWFKFWLQGLESDTEGKSVRYGRWRKMRDEQCAWDQSENKKPTYCEFASPQ